LKSTIARGVKPFRVHDGQVPQAGGEDFEFVGDADVVAVRREAVGDSAIPDLVVHEGFYHPAFQRHPANPVVRLQAHGFTPPEKW
jgi:hypothetical protein